MKTLNREQEAALDTITQLAKQLEHASDSKEIARITEEMRSARLKLEDATRQKAS